MGRLLIGFSHVDAGQGYLKIVAETHKAWMSHLGPLIAKLLKVAPLIQVLLRVEHENFEQILVNESFQGWAHLRNGLLFNDDLSLGSLRLFWLLDLDVLDLLGWICVGLNHRFLFGELSRPRQVG